MFTFNKVKKITLYTGLVLSAALTAAFVYFGFINTDMVTRAEARSYISVAERVYMQTTINQLVAQVMQGE